MLLAFLILKKPKHTALDDVVHQPNRIIETRHSKKSCLPLYMSIDTVGLLTSVDDVVM